MDCASKPWRARYRSAYPGASLWPKIVVQHTRLDSRTSDVALMTTVAYGE